MAVRVLLLLLAVPAQAALVPGPDHPVSAPDLGGAFGYNWPLSLATDGTDFLTVWVDETLGREGIYATIVTPTGATRPLSGKPLATGFFDAHAIWTGDSYLVTMGNKAIRLDRDAQPLSAVEPTGLPPGADILRLAWNGTRALALVGDFGKTSLALLDASGRLVRADITVPSSVPAYRTVLASAGERFVIVWIDEVADPQPWLRPQSTVRACTVSTEGDVSDAVTLLAPFRGYASLDAASGAAAAGVVVVSDGTATRELHRYTIAATLGVHEDAVVPMEAPGNSALAVATPDGFIASYVYYDLGTRLAALPFGSSLRTSVPVEAGNELHLLANSNAGIAVWGFGPVRGAGFDAHFRERRTSVLPVAIAPLRQTTPALASGNGVVLAAWVEAVDFTTGRLLARRFAASGEALDAAPIELALSATLHWQPAIVFTGEAWLIAWQTTEANNTRVQMHRVSAAGELMEATAIDAGPYARPALAFNGKVVALAVTSWRGELTSVLRFSPDGARRDAEPLFLTDLRNQGPAIATNGAEFLIVWSHDRHTVFARRLDSTGAPLDAAPATIADTPLRDDSPSIASDGSDFLVAYEQYEPVVMADPPRPDPPPTPVNRVFAKRVLRSGVLADTTAEQTGSLLGEGHTPAIASDGKRYLVSLASENLDPGAPSSEDFSISVVAVDRNGAALEPPREVVRAGSTSSLHALTATTNGTFWTVYSRIAPETAGVQRVFFRALGNEVGRRRSSRK